MDPQIYVTAPRPVGWWYVMQPVERAVLNTVRNPLDYLLTVACAAQHDMLYLAEREEVDLDPRDLSWSFIVPLC